MINKETILKIYNGELKPIELSPPKSSEYRNNSNRIINLQEKISNFLSDDKKNLVDEFYDIININASFLAEQAFEEGFSIGLRLACESFINIKE